MAIDGVLEDALMEPYTPFSTEPPRVWTLPALLRAMQQKQIHWLCRGVPHRKWSTEQQLSLLDSVLQGYPIGALVLWRNESGEYLLDGQARMNVLLSAFPCVDRIDTKVTGNVCVELPTGEIRLREFGATQPPHWIPTEYLLTTQGFRSQLRRLWDLKLDREADALGKIRDCFLEYKVPVMYVATNREERALEVRERVNAVYGGDDGTCIL